MEPDDYYILMDVLVEVYDMDYEGMMEELLELEVLYDTELC